MEIGSGTEFRGCISYEELPWRPIDSYEKPEDVHCGYCGHVFPPGEELNLMIQKDSDLSVILCDSCFELIFKQVIQVRLQNEQDKDKQGV